MNKKQLFFGLKTYKLPIVVAGCASLVIWDQIRQLCAKVYHKSRLQSTNSQPQYIYIDELKNEELLRKFEPNGPVTNELYKLTQLYLWASAKVRGSQLYEDIFSWYENLAWRYLALSKEETVIIRRLGVTSLAHLSELSDATCRQIAQASDLRTAVGIARTKGSNHRLISDPPRWSVAVDQRDVLHRLHNFMLKLDADSPHPCLQYVISKSFAEMDQRTFDDDLSFTHAQIKPYTLHKCVDAILHHSWVPSNIRSIVHHGGLSLLVDTYKLLLADMRIDTLIAMTRILSNISMNPEYHTLLHISGCIKILAQLLNHDDVRVSIPAARALINCDSDAQEWEHVRKSDKQFARNVYPLHPIFRPNHRQNAPNVDVIFIHGLLGGAFVSWRQRDKFLARNLKVNEKQQMDLPVDGSATDFKPKFSESEKGDQDFTLCWPRDWLPEDCSYIRVLGINYDTNISMWAPMCPIAPKRPTLSDRSSNLIDALEKAGVGARPIIWVAHSMGGLIVKHLLVKCAERSDTSRSLLEQTAGIIFCSTPHRGSRLASLSLTTQMIFWPTVEVQELRQNSPALLSLHEKFLELLKRYPMKILSFAERLPTWIKAVQMEVTFVDDESSYIETGELYGVPLDHLCICKPATRKSFLYGKIVDFIHDITNKTKQPKNGAVSR